MDMLPATPKGSLPSVALRVRGVGAVAQEPEVRLPSDKKLADDEILVGAFIC